MSIQNIKDDIRSLRGASVQIFGQPQILRDVIEEGTIDILDVLERLEEFEVKDLIGKRYIEEDDDYEECTFESVEEYLDHLDELDDLKELKADNSYNWSSPISNDFNFTIYENSSGKILIEFKVHRFGDVRANYTDYALLEFDDEYLFLEALSECNKTINVDGYDIEIDIFSDGYEVYENGDYVKTIYDLDDIQDIGA